MKGKNALKIALFMGFVVGISGAFWLSSSQPKRMVLMHWSWLKKDAPDSSFDELTAQYHADNHTIHDAISAFIAHKKGRALRALQAEWQITDQKVDAILSHAETRITHMKETSAVCKQIVSPKLKRTAPIIKDIITQKKIHNASLKTVCGPKGCTPAIFFDHRKKSDKLQFILELPLHFGLQDESFQRGILEHELTHMERGHSIIAHELFSYLEQRDQISEQDVINSRSVQKWMRACEYEADLLPAAESNQTAQEVLEAVSAFTVTDELHPPTRHRIKMLTRVARLHEADERLKQA